MNIATAAKLEAQTSNFAIPTLYGPALDGHCLIGIKGALVYGWSGTREIFFNAQTSPISEIRTIMMSWPFINVPEDFKNNYHIFCMT
jgi:hypothetical protein